MTTKAEVQDLLRFLTQDAKIPLPTAMGKIKELQQSSLTDVLQLSKSSLESIKPIFVDEKVAKQVINAAKRVSKKRSSDAPSNSPVKRSKKLSTDDPLSPKEIEESLTLPMANADEDELLNTVIYTNRAPLVLAFAVMLLKYTLPSQPLSSRLSLAQAVVSANSRSKAVSIGLAKGSSAEEEGWGQGQPVVRVMGREIRVLKRWGYNPNEDSKEASSVKEDADDPQSSASTVKAENELLPKQKTYTEPALWGLDLEALRSSNGSTLSGSKHSTQNLPIYTPESARAYIMRSFESASNISDDSTDKKKKPIGNKANTKERNVALLLRTLDLLYESWASYLKPEELDGRAWSWYVHVRPEVQSGVAGWGGKGEVKLSKILDMRRKG